MQSDNQIRREITSRIIKGLEQGVAPWRQPWINHKNAGLPSNVKSNKRYQGVNTLLLRLISVDQNYQSKFWGTYQQWKSLGGSVKRGEASTRIVYYKPFKRQVINADGTQEQVSSCVMKTYCVFNADQTTLDEYQVKDLQTSEDYSVAYSDAESVISNTKAVIRHGGNQACYYPLQDFIQMPSQNQFPNMNEYYETLFHELCHWSESRLNWAASYELNELVAEIGACFISSELGIPQSENLENHTAYLASWLTKLESNPNWIFKASSQASKVTDFILSFQSGKPVEKELEEISF